MAIAKNAVSSGGKFISEPGDYLVEISEVQAGKSSKGDPMVTITFVTDEDKSIRAFFVKKHAFMMAALTLLKVSCGEKPEVNSAELVGKKCGIKVELGKPNDKGMIFAQIVGYGRPEDVEHAKHDASLANSHASDEIPF